MSESRKRFLSVSTIALMFVGAAAFVWVFFNANQSESINDYEITRIPIDDLESEIPRAYKHKGFTVYAFRAPPLGEPLVLKGAVKYNDVDYYRVVGASKGVASTGESYAFKESGRWGLFNIRGEMVATEGLWYSGNLEQIPYQVQHGYLLLGP